MAFIGNRKTLFFTQRNHATPEKVFPLLCPVREKDWLDGWDYEMIFSLSGVAEQDCVFATPHHGEQKTIWYVSHYDNKNYQIEFIRTTPLESVVKINIQLKPVEQSQTEVNISYQYLGLNENENNHITNTLEKEFITSMQWWEKAINHYLKTGEKLIKPTE